MEVWRCPGPPLLGDHRRPLLQVKQVAVQIQVPPPLVSFFPTYLSLSFSPSPSLLGDHRRPLLQVQQVAVQIQVPSPPLFLSDVSFSCLCLSLRPSSVITAGNCKSSKWPSRYRFLLLSFFLTYLSLSLSLSPSLLGDHRGHCFKK